MLRLIHSRSTTLATVELEGKLVGPWVDEVRTAVAALRTGQSVCLNLQHLMFADAAGLNLLCALQRDGVLLSGASPLIDGLMRSCMEQALRPRNAGERG